MRDRLLEGLPVKERRLDVAGVNTALLEGGDGSPLVLLHGGIQAGGVVWWRSIPPLVENNRVVVPDLPGLGESGAFERLDTSTTIKWLGDVIEKTTDEPPTLVAHSLLGVFAARFAIEHGDRLRRLVLVDSPGLGKYRPRPRLVMALLKSMLRPGTETLGRFMGEVVFDLEVIREEEGDRWDTFMSYLVSLATKPGVKQTMRRLPRGNLGPIPDAELRRIKIPISLIWGKYDPNTRLETAERAAQRFEWPLQVIERAGHIPHLEQPDLFANALRSVMTAGRRLQFVERAHRPPNMGASRSDCRVSEIGTSRICDCQAAATSSGRSNSVARGGAT
ncbi:MAG: alpha/beta fold hydrolase [Acidimicrobiia bacterium]